MARPKRQQSTPERTENVSTSNENIEAQETKETEKVASKDKVIETKQEKVIEVKTEKVIEELPAEVRKKKYETFTIFVKGVSREVSRQVYNAVSKDPKLNVSLPKRSPLAKNMKAPEKPCKDC